MSDMKDGSLSDYRFSEHFYVSPISFSSLAALSICYIISTHAYYLGVTSSELEDQAGEAEHGEHPYGPSPRRDHAGMVSWFCY